MAHRRCVLSLSLAAALLGACAGMPADSPSGPVTPYAGAPPSFVALVQRVGPAVVNVISRPASRGTGAEPPQGGTETPAAPAEPRTGEQAAPGQGVGSGVIIDGDGYILTNAHLVAGQSAVRVRMPDSKQDFPATIIGIDRQTDVALLKIDAHRLPTARVGDSAKVQQGEWVAAIGSPFGLANTITAGIVSAKDRALPVGSVVGFIQTDVAINPGNSGGPLLNMRGEVVGINSQIYSRTGGYMGVSFAIPINVAMDVARQLRFDGHVTRGRLGIGVQAVDDALAPSLQLDHAGGVLVTWVEEGSAAAESGLAAGDVILKFDGKDVGTTSELAGLVGATRPGSRVVIEVWRQGAPRTLHAAIGKATAKG